MEIGKVIEIGTREVDIPTIAPARKEPAPPVKEPERQPEKEDA